MRIRASVFRSLGMSPLCVRGLAAKTPVSKTGRRRFESCRACNYPTIERWADPEVAATVAVSSMAPLLCWLGATGFSLRVQRGFDSRRRYSIFGVSRRPAGP